MIWILLFIIVVGLSFLLAMRSMKDYQEIPASVLSYGLFLIRKPNNLNSDTIQNIGKALLKREFFSLEKLYKGNSSVMAIFAPKNFQQQFPELDLLEIEDYLEDPSIQDSQELGIDKKALLNDSFSWVIKPNKDVNIKPDFLKKIALGHNQKFFWQIVSRPENGVGDFQITARAMVIEKDSIARVEMAKKIDNELASCNLNKEENESSAKFLFTSFKRRTLIPKEVRPFIVDKLTLIKLMGE